MSPVAANPAQANQAHLFVFTADKAGTVRGVRPSRQCSRTTCGDGHVCMSSGMVGVDKERIARVIYEASKGSAYFQRAQENDRRVDEQVKHMRSRLATAPEGEIEAARRRCVASHFSMARTLGCRLLQQSSTQVLSCIVLWCWQHGEAACAAGGRSRPVASVGRRRHGTTASPMCPVCRPKPVATVFHATRHPSPSCASSTVDRWSVRAPQTRSCERLSGCVQDMFFAAVAQLDDPSLRDVSNTAGVAVVGGRALSPKTTRVLV